MEKEIDEKALFTIARSLSYKSFREIKSAGVNSNRSTQSNRSPRGDSKKDEDSADIVEVSSRKSFKLTKNRDSNTAVQQMGTSKVGEMASNRDPNNLNSQVQIEFDDVVGEPEGLRSPDFCWNLSSGCYTYTQKFMYIILVVLCAPIIAFINGCNFACLAFCHVWCIGPCLRCWKINCGTARKFILGCCLAAFAPCYETCGLLFSKVKVRYQKLPDGDQRDEDYADSYFST